MEAYIKNTIDVGDIYINNLYNFYDIKELVKKMKKKSPVLFEDVLVQVGQIVMMREPTELEKINKGDEVNTKLEEFVKSELYSMFPTNKYKFKEMSEDVFNNLMNTVIHPS